MKSGPPMASKAGKGIACITIAEQRPTGFSDSSASCILKKIEFGTLDTDKIKINVSSSHFYSYEQFMFNQA